MAISRDQRQLALGIIPCAIVSVAAFFVVPWFNGIFVSAGVGLPWPTRVLLTTYPWWSVTVLITLVLWRLWPAVPKRGGIAANFGMWCSLVLLVFGVIGCYAPIFALTGGFR